MAPSPPIEYEWSIPENHTNNDRWSNHATWKNIEEKT